MSRAIQFRILNAAIPALVPVIAMAMTNMEIYDYSIVDEFVILSAVPFLIFVFFVPSNTAIIVLLFAMRLGSVVLLLRKIPASRRGMILKTLFNLGTSVATALMGLFFLFAAQQ